MKFLSLLVIIFTISTNSIQAQYSADYPIYASDNMQALQGIKQKVGTTVISWTRPAANNLDLSKYIGAMAINPTKLNQVFFVDNSTVPKLYTFNNISLQETFTGKTFVGATQGSNGTTALPLLQNEEVFGINMMTISSSLNKGFAICKNHCLYSFDLTGSNPISAPTLITDAPNNAVSFANTKGGGLMANSSNKLTALVNVLQADFTYKYYFFEINPTTFVAKFIKQTFINYNGFDDNTMFIGGAGVTLDGSVYSSLYNGNESTLYKFDPTLNKFDVNLATFNQSIGDVTGAGQVIVNPGGEFITSGTLTIDFNELSGLYNAKDKTSTIKWGLYSDELITKFYLQSSIDGINFRTVAIQNPSSAYGQNNYVSTISSNSNSIVYYRIAAVKPNNTQKISKIVSVDETNNIKTFITTYPNPATSLLTIKLSNYKVITQINLLDLKGKVVAKIKGSSVSVLSKQINLLELNIPTGQYYVQVVFDNNENKTVAVKISR